MAKLRNPVLGSLSSFVMPEFSHPSQVHRKSKKSLSQQLVEERQKLFGVKNSDNDSTQIITESIEGISSLQADRL
jgi:hypothetical protein